MCTKRFDRCLWPLLLPLCLAGAAVAQMRVVGIPMPQGAAGPGGMVNLPYVTPDNSGGMWYVYNDGSIRQQMQPAVYSQGGMLTVNGNQFSANNNQGNLAKSGELVLRNPDMGDVAVTRRIFFDKANNYVRYVDVLHNSSAQDVTANIVIQSTFNWGITQGQLIADPKHKEQNVAWTGMTNMGRAVLEVFGGSGGKFEPVITYQNGGNAVQASYTIVVPAKKDACLMHLHLFVPTLEAGGKFVADLKTDKLIRGLPPEIRKTLANFSAEQDWLSDLSILRGDVFDVVELRGGDEYKGTLSVPNYNLTTFYGPIQLQPSRVVAMLNVGQSRPRQLVVTDDGEIFGGQLDQQTIDMQLTSGQTVKIPLEQVNRMGYRKRPNEPDEWTFDKPMALMRAGDRVVVDPPAEKIQAATRYGTLALDPLTIAAILFQPDEGGVHQIYLTDGSHLAGLICSDNLEMKLSGAGPAQTVRFPVSGMLRLQLLPKTPEVDAEGPSLALSNQDLLCGSLTGQLSLQTAFDTIAIDGSQIRHIGRSGSDLQVTLWDGSIISGQVTQPSADCRLLSGAVLSVPLGLLTEYNQPNPLPSADMVKQIQAAAVDLSADDWRQRDRAEAALTTMGPAVIGVLRQLRAASPPEAQQRIDAIVKKLQPQQTKPQPTPPDDANKQ